jgi:hypothetical protein
MAEETHMKKDQAGTGAKWLGRAFGGLCVSLVIADLFQHKHVHFGFQSWIGFDAGLAFVACFVIAIAAKLLLPLLVRGKDFYD